MSDTGANGRQRQPLLSEEKRSMVQIANTVVSAIMVALLVWAGTGISDIKTELTAISTTVELLDIREIIRLDTRVKANEERVARLAERLAKIERESGSVNGGKNMGRGEPPPQ